MLSLYRVPAPGKPNQASGRAKKLLASLSAFSFIAVAFLTASPGFAWEYWGGDQGGTRFSKLAQITPANVGDLVRAWEFHTGDRDSRPPAAMARTKFEATPLFVEEKRSVVRDWIHRRPRAHPSTGAAKRQ